MKKYVLFFLLLVTILVSSCGSTTKALIRNKAEGTSTTVTITTNNPTSINADPSVSLETPKSE